MGIVALLRPFFTFYVNCDYNENGRADCPEIFIAEEDHDLYGPWSITPIDTLPYLICYEQEIELEDGYWDTVHLPPFYLGIVLDETNEALVSHVDEVMTIIGSFYGEGDIYNETRYGSIGDEDFNCEQWSRDTNNVNWTEGSLLKYFSNEDELEEYVRDDLYGAAGYNFENDAANGALRPVAAAIVFKSVSDDGKIWDYSLRFNQSRVPYTWSENEYRIVDRVTKDGSSLESQSRDQYLWSGFLNVQGMLDTAITQYIAIDVNDYPYINQTYLANFIKGSFVFPFTSYKTDYYWLIMQVPFVVFAGIMFIYPVIQIISVLVTEKSSKIKEGMKMYVTYFSYEADH